MKLNLKISAKVTPASFGWSQKASELFIFGGEFEERNSERVTYFNDLYKFNADKQRWSWIKIPKRYAARPRESVF